jgi:hypothetical protein
MSVEKGRVQMGGKEGQMEAFLRAMREVSPLFVFFSREKKF